MVVGAPKPEEGEFGMTSAKMTSPSPKKTSDIDDTYKDDDWFDLDKYKQAAQVAYDFSIGKMQEEGDQTRQNIGKTGFEQRETNKQQQRFSEKDEARDYRQANEAYRF